MTDLNLQCNAISDTEFKLPQATQRNGTGWTMLGKLTPEHTHGIGWPGTGLGLGASREIVEGLESQWMYSRSQSFRVLPSLARL
eukprot:1040300-Rhodomonas_salina.1